MPVLGTPVGLSHGFSGKGLPVSQGGRREPGLRGAAYTRGMEGVHVALGPHRSASRSWWGFRSGVLREHWKEEGELPGETRCRGGTGRWSETERGRTEAKPLCHPGGGIRAGRADEVHRESPRAERPAPRAATPEAKGLSGHTARSAVTWFWGCDGANRAGSQSPT